MDSDLMIWDYIASLDLVQSGVQFRNKMKAARDHPHDWLMLRNGCRMDIRNAAPLLLPDHTVPSISSMAS